MEKLDDLNINGGEEYIKSRLETYISNIYRAHKIADDIDDIQKSPLNINPDFKTIEEEIKKHIIPLVRILFNMAKNNVGEKRLKYARALDNLKLFYGSEFDEVLSVIPTNEKAIEELIKKGGEEAWEEEKAEKTERKNKLKEKIKRLFKK